MLNNDGPFPLSLVEWEDWEQDIMSIKLHHDMLNININNILKSIKENKNIYIC